MKQLLIILLFVGMGTILPVQQAQAQLPIVDIIKAAIKKVIKAVDLEIQRQQNKVIWLQNAQKALENTLAKVKLDEISDWTSKQRELFKEYYEGLAKVKAVISYYQRIREISQKQIRLVNAYNRAWQVVRQDRHFTTAEVEYMAKVYSGILDESLKNIEQITLIARSFTTNMSDAKRLELINNAADRVEANYSDLTQFNRQNMLLSLQRARTEHEVEVVKKLYGLP